MLRRRSCKSQWKLFLFFVLCLIYLLNGFNEGQYFLVIISNSDTTEENTQKLKKIFTADYHLCRSNVTSTPVFHYNMKQKFENILETGSFKFHEDFKNPCFYKTKQFKIYKRTVFEQRTIWCLPYFYIIGFPKCATTDLWDRLLLHPQIVSRHEKESHYIDDKRFSTDNQWTFGAYMNYFSKTAKEIFKRCDGKLSGGEPCDIVTGEATANTAAVNDMWHLLPENRGCSEPRFTNPDYLYNINPNMKLIALIRDPVKRLWSDYIYLAKYFNYNTSREAFHQHAVNAVSMYEDCLKYFTPRGCANNGSIGSIQMRLRMGIYDVHVADWLRVFPRKLLLVIRIEDYKKNMSEVLQNIFEHLELDRPSKTVHQQMIETSRKNVNSKDFDMLAETKHLLYKFYIPSYEKLASILQESQYVFEVPDD